MTTAIRISENIHKSAKAYAKIHQRSIPAQVEYWAKIGKIAEDNPDLTFQFIQSMMLSMAQAKSGQTEPYSFG